MCAAGAASAVAHAAPPTPTTRSSTPGHPATGPHTTAGHKPSTPSHRVPGVADRLVLTFAVDPTAATPGQMVTFTVTLRETAPRGALGYALQFGDGSGSQSVPKPSCRADPGPPKQQTWTLHHRYRSPGVYRASVLGHASCSTLHIAQTIAVAVANG
jgi:hypothetical protein